MRWLVAVLPKTNLGYLEFNLVSSGLALAVMLPTTFCAGMSLPLITYVLLRQHGGERSIGAVYAANTVGAMVGVFFAIHVGLPLLGLQPLIVSGAALDMALGLVLLGRRRATALCALGAAATLLFARLDVYQMVSGVYRAAQEPLTPGNTRRLLHQDGKTTTVDLIDREGFLGIRTNGKAKASVNTKPNRDSVFDEARMVLSSALPLLLHPHTRTAANNGVRTVSTTSYQARLGQRTLRYIVLLVLSMNPYMRPKGTCRTSSNCRESEPACYGGTFLTLMLLKSQACMAASAA